MGKFVQDTEAAYVRMLSNRVERLRAQAEARGEKFHETRGLTALASGYSVRMRKDLTKTGMFPVVEVWPKADGTLVITEAAELASELLAHTSKLQGEVLGHLEFVPDV